MVVIVTAVVAIGTVKIVQQDPLDRIVLLVETQCLPLSG